MAETNQTIRRFFEVAAQREFSRDILFRVLNITFAGGEVFNENELVYVKSATLPGRSIVNVPVPYQGLPFNVPGVAQYPGSDSYKLDFYCDANSELRRKFERESRRVFDDATNTGEYNIPTSNSTLRLIQLDKNLDPTSIYKLVGASIRNVGEMSYAIAEGTGTVVSFEVTVSYHFFELEQAKNTQ